VVEDIGVLHQLRNLDRLFEELHAHRCSFSA
jgi:hypothetical protein